MGIKRANPVKPGFIQDFAGATAPAGWLFCAGQAISRATYAALFAAIGTAYGAGDGTTTFNVPDFRGRVSFGKDNMGGTPANRLTATGGVTGTTLGAAGGGETVTLGLAAIPAHSHTVQAAEVTAAVGGTTRLGTNASGVLPSNATGGGGAHQNIPPAQVVNKIIKT